MRNFQLISLIVFIVLAIVGLLMFGGFIPTPGPKTTDIKHDVVVWGTLPQRELRTLVNEISQNNDDLNVSYVEKSEDNLELDLLRSLADNSPPDVLLFPHDLFYSLRKNLTPIPASSLSVRTYKDLFIEGGEIFISNLGVQALPVVVDPLVMYWNRDILNSEQTTQIPTSWSSILSFASNVTKRDDRGSILQSGIALGESENVSHAKDILSLLLLQSGDNITGVGSTGLYQSVLGRSNSTGGASPAVSALMYYTGFSDPLKINYSWNSSLPVSFNAFVEGDLALYIGPASDYKKLKNANPFLNIDVAPVPQLDNQLNKNFGRFYGAGVFNNSKIPNAAVRVAYLLSVINANLQEKISENLYVAPTRRDALGKQIADPILFTIYKEAIIADNWVDPNPKATGAIFRRMINDISTRFRSVSTAVTEASSGLNELFQ